MKNYGKRILALALALIMLLTVLPSAVFASLLDNTPARNEEILSALTELAGSEDEAQRYYGVLRQYGLLDEDGKLPESWSIEMDGESLTTDELKEILKGEYDPDRYLWVDGTAVTLGDVKTMLEIEDYIAYVRDKYFSNGEWTQEQKASLASLRSQIKTEGIKLVGAGAVGPSGVNHGARVSVAQTAASGLTVTYTASLTGASSGQAVSFDWKAVSGSRPASGSGTVTLTADGNGTASESFTVTLGAVSPEGNDPVRTPEANNTVYYVDCSNIQNALFAGDRETLAIRGTAAGSVPAGEWPEAAYFDITGSSVSNLAYTSGFTPPALTELQRKSVAWGMADTATLMHDPINVGPTNKGWIAGGQFSNGSHNAIERVYIDLNIYFDLLEHSQYGSKDALNQQPVMMYEHKGYENDANYRDDCNLSRSLNAASPPQNVFIWGRKYVYWKAEDTGVYYRDLGAYPGWSYNDSAWPLVGSSDPYVSYSRHGGPLQYVDVTVRFSNNNPPTVKSISAPSDGSFRPGEVIPIVVTFSEPVKSGATITANGQVLTAAETGLSNRMTFPYAVQEVDNATSISVTSVSAVDGNNKALSQSRADVLSVHMDTPIKTHTFTGMSAVIGGTPAEPTLDVTLNVSGNERLTQWLGSDLKNESGVFTSQTVKASVDGQNFTAFATAGESVTGGTLTASVPLPQNTGEGPVEYTAELYVDGKLVIGRTASAELAPAVFMTADDMTLSLLVLQADGVTPYEYADESRTVYAQDDPTVCASYTLADKAYSFPTVTWTSSDPTVANIGEDGRITPTGKSGTAHFRLTAENGGVAGKTVYKETEALNFGAGLTPFLLIPNGDLQSLSDRDVTVYWSSNLCDKNGSGTETVFSVTVRRGGEVVYSGTVTGTAASPASSAVIPAEALAFQYGETAVNTFDVTVTSNYQGVEYAASATVSLESPPARVTLDPLNSYYILDTAGSAVIGWSITNFDRFSSEDAESLFKLLITKGGSTVYSTSDPGTGGADGHYTGSYTLTDLGVTASPSGSGSYRDVYTVTIQAKNGDTSTWSYDSFLLYVYDAAALKLWLQPSEAQDGRITGTVIGAGGSTADSLTMTNVPAISQMTQRDILALKRDISLRNVISANYGEFAWSELADQLAWASSDNDVATVNYQQGVLYEDIRSFAYTSYRPTTDFILSGLSDGETTVTAQHVLTGMTDSLDVRVQTLTDKLYLFQCYPQVTTTLTYHDSMGTEKTVTSDEKGAAAIYEADGIRGDVYLRSVDANGAAYLGTIYNDQLVSGERDSTKLELYPCNNLQLRRAAFAYLYLKNPDGTPYTGKITFRGGVYAAGEYKKDAFFALNSTAAPMLKGYEDQSLTLGADGKLEVVMDQMQWGLPDGQVHAGDKIAYTFLIKQGDGATAYYPVLVNVDATVNQDAYVGNGDAVVNFRTNTGTGEHPFIVAQTVTVKNPETGYKSTSNVLDDTGRVGLTDSLPEAELTTVAMWWGDGVVTDPKCAVQLFTGTGKKIAPDASTLSNDAYPFVDEVMTTYTVPMTKDTLKGTVDEREIRSMYIEYYRDGVNLTRKEDLALRVCNLLGVGKVENSDTIAGQLKTMGAVMGTDAKQTMGVGDYIVGLAMDLVAGDGFSVGQTFTMKVTPTSDPTMFLGFVQVGLGNMSESNVTGVYANGSSDTKASYTPGFKELCLLCSLGTDSALTKYGMKYMNDYNKVLKRKGSVDPSYTFGGYLETLIYFDFGDGKWKMQVIDGGFHAGGGVSYRREWNQMVGPVPFTTELSVGGTAEVSMDAITAAYIPSGSTTGDAELDNEFLTQLRIYLYLKLFAGVGFDYSVVALKLGIFGQISLDMQFEWLNRPYLKDHSDAVLLSTGQQNGEKANLNGQHFKIDGQVGLEFVVKFLFISYEKALFSFSFNLLNKATGKWDTINDLWSKNQKSLRSALSSLLNRGSAGVSTVGSGQQIVTLNLAPTVESRDYLKDGGRTWGASTLPHGFVGSAATTSAVSNLESNTYPYADPELTRDGRLLIYLTDQGSADVADTRAAFAVKSGESYAQGGVIDQGGYGDSQLSVDGTGSFAVAAWTRQSVKVDKDAGALLTDDDQMMMMNGTEVYASVYTGDAWTTVALTDDSGADMAPVAAVGNGKAVVAWRSVATASADSITDFGQKDTILYRIYDGTGWGAVRTLYNGTSGTVKGITAAMTDDGTAAVAYTLDTDGADSTFTDREIVYAVLDSESGEVVRNVRTTNDDKVDENPQLAAVSFPSDAAGGRRFVLGWYTQETDAAGSSDICLLDFDAAGVTGQLLPQSLNQVASDADVSISSDFRFTKNAASINDLSLVWVERDEGTTQEIADSDSEGTEGQNANAGAVKTEKDVLKSVKFFTYGQYGERVGFTGALSVAEMPDATLIDHFDAYVADGVNVTAAILGTTYGKNGETETKEAVTMGSDVVQYTVPKAVSAMYTATDSYADKIEVPLVSADYDAVKLGATMQILLNVENAGIHPVTDLSIAVGGTVTEYHGLNLLPGSTIRLGADYDVPEDRVVDPAYTVTATFAGDTAKTASGKVYLNFPDLRITDAQIVEELEGRRVIQTKLDNRLDSALAGSGRRVRISFWSDPACETAISSLPAVIVSDDADLKMIDEGGFSCQTVFDAAAYVRGTGAEVQEIPESGIPVYILAEVLDAAGEPVPEPVRSNNCESVVCENLKARSGQDVMLVSDVDVSGTGAGATTTVTVNMQNTRLNQTTTGNLIVTLLDKDGQIVEQKQSYTGQGTDNNCGLITLAGEAKDTETFVFEKTGASAQVVYSDVLLNADNANLASLTFSSIPGVTLESFERQADGMYAAYVVTDDLTSTAVMAVTESGLSKAKTRSNGGADSGNSNAISEDVPLTPGQMNTVTVTVRADDGTENVYVLTVRNNGDPTIGEPVVTENLHYGTKVTYGQNDTADIQVVAVQTPDGSTYDIGYQWFACDDVSGANPAEITDFAGADTDTLTVPDSVGAGVHYYICRVSRTLLSGGTQTYWSSVASVEVVKGPGNAVNVTDLVVDVDGQPHALPAATADKAGSTVVYSADGGTSWFTAIPSFTEVGVHTVWVKATNPNYVDTEIKTADVLIQGDPTVSEPSVTLNVSYGTNVTYGTDDTATVDIVATKEPLSAPYALSYLWYECDVRGDSRQAVTHCEGADTDTLTVLSDVGAGVHYYICKVTRTTAAAGQTSDVWSSVASVVVVKGTGNAVTLTDTVATFDNQPHGLSGVEASKTGSGFHYSADGETWSDTAPTFTAVGAHTVWVYADNPNYEDTQVVTGTVTIRENEDALYRLETQDVSAAFASYPQAIREQFGSADGLEAALKASFTKQKLTESSIAVYDVKLMFSLDGGATWVESTKDNFPTAGAEVVLPCPEGMNWASYFFYLKHLITDPMNTEKTAGTIEDVESKTDKEGVRFTADCLSPFALGWKYRTFSDEAEETSPTYTSTLAGTEHGSVDVSRSSAEKGALITVTPRPDAGYTVDAVIVLDAKNKPVPVTNNGDGTWSYLQPEGDVTVAVTFAAEQASGASSCPKDATCPMSAFRDLDMTKWYHDGVHWALESNVMNGVGSGRFDPNGTTSRAMIVTILYRMEGSPAVTAGNPFTDVKSGKWYTDAVIWAAQNKIVEGYGNGKFGPDNKITREQLAAILYRYAKTKGQGFTGTWAFKLDYPDASAVSSWADEAMHWCVMKEIINGKNGKLVPGGSASRAEAATMLMRYCTKA